MSVLNLAQCTPGDTQFYSRWLEFGEVYTNPSIARDVTILVVDQHFIVTDEFLKGFPKLQFVCSATTGHTHLQFKNPVTLVTLRGEKEFLRGVRSVSEHVIREMLFLASSGDTRHLLSGKTVGIIGLGRIGNHVSWLCTSLGMKVLSFDKDDNRMFLEDIFKEADFISIHLDENPGTHKMINKRLLYSMKPKAYFINTSRGSIVDNEALFELVESGLIGGASIDVCDIPVPQFLPGIFHYTHHTAGSTFEDRVRTDEFIVKKLRGLIQSQRSIPLPLPS